MSVITTTRLVQLLGEWRHGGAAADRLAATVRALVLDGRIPLDSRLPAERRLAAALGVSRSTVTAAYDRLRAEGYLASRQGSGSRASVPRGHRVASDPAAGPDMLDLRIAALPAPALLQELAGEAVAELPRWLDHHGYDTSGLPPLRAAIAARFTARGLPTTAEQVMVTSGALQALDLAIRAVFPRGRTALAEIPSYPAALDALRHAGARIRSVPVTREGWDLEALEAVVAAHPPALAYLIPDFHNPTGAVMAEASRARAMRALRRTGAHVVIDETFADVNLDGEPLPAPMAGAGGDQTITIGSLSKSVWGGLRIGWARAEPSVIGRLAAARAATDMAGPVIEQLLATLALQRMDEIVRDRRRQLVARRTALLGALARHLPDWRYATPRGGMFVWAELPDPLSTSLSILAAEHGVALTPGPRFGAPGVLERYLRLPFALTPAQLEDAVATLARIAPLARRRDDETANELSYVA